MQEEKKQIDEEKNRSYLYITLKKFYERLLKIRGHPREIALGFALGIFVGMSPTIGFQTPIAIFLAAIFKWNKVSSALGVWISNPVTAPAIYSITYVVGAYLLGIRKVGNTFNDVDTTTVMNMLSGAPEILWAMFVGGVITGLPLSIICYYFCYSAVQKYQEGIKIKLVQQKEKLARQKKILVRKREERKQKKKKKKNDKVT
ncbi:DUF2062 domain-containing protein [Desulfococcaceae bacterium HSG8]|nr:DUF2062 domain-containing protein [Desulfococcaceae bacterium HSG8]